MEKRHGERREGGHQERGHKRGHHGGGYSVLAKPEGTQLLFIGSRSCSRHKGCHLIGYDRNAEE